MGSRPRRVAAENRVRPQREDVRARIRAAAAERFHALGYRATSIDAIAKAAGFTKGAVYSNFASKHELFLDLLAARIATYADDVKRRIQPAGGLDDLLEVVAQRLAHEVVNETAWHVLVVEFAVVAARDPELGHAYAALRAQHRSAFVERLHDVAPGVPDELAQSALTMLLAAVNGLAVESAVSPGTTDIGHITRVLRGILSSILAPHNQQ